MINNFKEILKEVPANPIVETIQATVSGNIATFNLPEKDNFYLYILTINNMSNGGYQGSGRNFFSANKDNYYITAQEDTNYWSIFARDYNRQVYYENYKLYVNYTGARLGGIFSGSKYQVIAW